MIKFALTTLATGVLSAGLALAASLDGQETYDLLFRNGTLDDLDRSAVLLYERRVTNTLKPESAKRDSGDVALTISEGDGPLATLQLRQDERHRGLGRFPASVGNPMIMYFYESIVRDMAESAGGSPFYIRNRVKDALVQPSEVEIGEAEFEGEMIETQTVHLRPFEDDPNAGRMKGFGDLTLSVTMSEDVPGWYLSLVAEAAGADAPVYRSEVSFQGLESVQ